MLPVGLTQLTFGGGRFNHPVAAGLLPAGLAQLSVSLPAFARIQVFRLVVPLTPIVTVSALIDRYATCKPQKDPHVITSCGENYKGVRLIRACVCVCVYVCACRV